MDLPRTGCQAICFKNSSYIFSKSGRVWDKHECVCTSQKGYLVSIETEEEWQFINHEIQKRVTSNTSAWHIGLKKMDGVWTWLSGKRLNISKWRDSEPDCTETWAEISKSGGLFNGISEYDENAYICEMPGECPNITFNNSWYIISVYGWSWNWNRVICQSQGGDLISIETEEEWNFINNEIQRRNTKKGYNDSWSIGLRKKAGTWTWVSGRPLTFCKWGKWKPSGEHDAAIMCKRSISGEQGVFGSVNRTGRRNAYICEITNVLATTPSPSPSSSSSPSKSPSPSPSPLRQLIKEYVSKFGGINITRRNSVQEAVAVFEDFTIKIKNVTKDKAGTEEVKTLRMSILEVAGAVEKFALNYGKRHLSGKRSLEMIVFPKIAYPKNASGFHFEEQQWRARIDIPSSNFEENGSMVVACVYKNLHDLLLTDQVIRSETDHQRYINSRIMAVTMDPKPEKLEENVILKFKNLKVLTAEKRCMFWSGLSKSFSEEGCHVVTSKSNSEETVCSCNHLTHFAVLMDYAGSTKLTEEDETILKTITYVGLSLSIVGILLTLILYSCLTDVRQPLSQIRLSVSMSLGVGQIIFLAGISATEHKAACVSVAALVQYFLMVAFCWMLIEAIYLYFFVVKVYNINTKMYMYHVTSWGLPMIMVAISLGIAAGKEGLQSYTSDKYCWLSSTNNLIWIFVTFVAFIETLNMLILVRVIKEMTNLVQPTVEDNHFQQIRLGIKACVVMIPLLGVTWLFGLLSPVHKAFAYIFTILNSTQGLLIFALHGMRDTQIRERFERKMNIVFPFHNSTRKSPHVNPSEVGNVWAVELQS